MTLVPQSPRILVVDDEPYIRQALAHALTLEGFAVVEAETGADALAHLNAQEFQLMLLDMGLPDFAGTEILDRLRTTHPHLPVMVLTGNATLESAIAAVRAGAVDYILKPISIQKLMVTVRRVWQQFIVQERERALLHTMRTAFADMGTAPTPAPRYDSTPPSYAKSPTIRLDRNRRHLVFGDATRRSVPLTETEESIVSCLLDHPGAVMSCRELVKRALGYDEEDEYTAQVLIRPYVSRLRKKLGDDPQAPHYIQTIRGRGYLWAEGVRG